MSTQAKHDYRKRYPTGTRGAAEIGAFTGEPQTHKRGREFAQIIGDTITEARALLEARLREAGFSDLRVKIIDADLDYGFDGEIVRWYDDPDDA